jgi:sensor histidine kinase YesM
MKLIALDSPQMMVLQQRPTLKETLLRTLSKKTVLGFSLKEGIGWLSIHTVISGIAIYFHSSNALITDSLLMLFSALFYTGIQALAIYPFWQLFFILWSNKKPSFIIGYQFAASILYAFLVSIALRIIMLSTDQMFFGESMPGTYLLESFLIYFIHQFIFTAYHSWWKLQLRLAKQKELEVALEKQKLAVLKAQIEPHFLFNTLNSISASVPPSQETTRILIAQLADTFRYALDVNERQWISVNEEIEFLKCWLALEECRFGDRLRVVYKIEERCLQQSIPAMVLQPIIENALRHGLSPKREGGQVTIECSMSEDALAVSISDTGVGYEGDLKEMFGKGIGLQNSCRRLQLLFNETLGVERGDKGLRFYFRVPLQFHSFKPANMDVCPRS